MKDFLEPTVSITYFSEDVVTTSFGTDHVNYVDAENLFSDTVPE